MSLVLHPAVCLQYLWLLEYTSHPNDRGNQHKDVTLRIHKLCLTPFNYTYRIIQIFKTKDVDPNKTYISCHIPFIFIWPSEAESCSGPMRTSKNSWAKFHQNTLIWKMKYIDTQMDTPWPPHYVFTLCCRKYCSAT